MWSAGSSVKREKKEAAAGLLGISAPVQCHCDGALGREGEGWDEMGWEH